MDALSSASVPTLYSNVNIVLLQLGTDWKLKHTSTFVWSQANTADGAISTKWIWGVAPTYLINIIYNIF